MDPQTINEAAIVSTAPRREACRTSAERQWRDFVLKVQRHDCRKKCFSKGADGEVCSECRYGYPRPRSSDHHFDEATQRWFYMCEKDEDERLSTYVPLWLLATGSLAAKIAQFCDVTLTRPFRS